MSKPLSGSAQPYVLVLCTPKNRQQAEPLLTQLTARGYALRGQDGGATTRLAKRASAVVAFLSAAFAEDDGLQQVLQEAHAAGVAVVPVLLDNAEQPEPTRQALLATNAIMADRYETPEALADRLCSAPELAASHLGEAQRQRLKRRTALFVAAAACALVVAVVLASRAFASSSGQANNDAALVAAQKLGLTEEDLEHIRDVIIVGDNTLFINPDDPEYEPADEGGELPLHWDYTSNSTDDDGTRHWFWNEDGSEAQLASYDLSFLTLLPNLQRLSLVDVDLSSMPSLADAANLNTVMLYSDVLPEDGLAFMEGSPVTVMDLGDCAAEDLAPLNACPQLEDLIISRDSAPALDLTGFAPPAMAKLDINGATAGLESLSGCAALRELTITDSDQLTNLDFLADAQELESLSVKGALGLANASALTACPKLSSLRFDYAPQLADLAFLSQMPQLESVDLFGVPFTDLAFLADVKTKDGFHLGFFTSFDGQVDYSGLAQIDRFSYLNVHPGNDGYAPLAQQLADASIGTLELNQCDGVDLGALPAISRSLSIADSDLQSLEGLDQPTLRELSLSHMPYLSSLDGIEGAPNLFDYSVTDPCRLVVDDCVRLTDYDALAGKSLGRIELRHLLFLPDFSLLNANEIHLEEIDGLDDLSCFDALDRTRMQTVELVGLDELKSLEPLARLRNSGHLSVPPQLADQAEALVENGSFMEWSVEYPEGGWEDTIAVELLSLDELDTLPQALLSRVERLTLAGDDVVKEDETHHAEWDDEANDGQGGMVVVTDGSDKRTPCTPGTLDDLSALKPLTGLRELTVCGQPLTSLKGLESAQGLESLTVNWCRDLEDCSAAFALPSLRRLELLDEGLTSVQGIQNLVELEDVTLSWNNELEDLSPLLELPNLQHVRVSDTMEKGIESLGDDYDFELEVEQSGA